MGTYRKRFNEKARAGQMAKLKELRRARNKQFFRQEECGGPAEPSTEPSTESEAQAADPNMAVLQPLSQAEKERRKRELEELLRPPESKTSRAKRKRLDKFIEHQLRREERKAVIEKLQAHKVDTTLLASSKELGRGRQTKREEFAEALSLERQGRRSAETDAVLYEEYQPLEWEDGDEDEREDENAEGRRQDKQRAAPGAPADRAQPTSASGSTGFGFASARVVGSGKKAPKKTYNWRQRVELEEQRKHAQEDADDFETSEESDVGTESDAGAESDAAAVAESFKAWAGQQRQRLEGDGRPPALATPRVAGGYQAVVRPEDLDDGLGPEGVAVDETLQRSAAYVSVRRSPAVQQSRAQLPVFAEEHRIMEAVHHHDVVIICGETGSGKTTQVPQFLYEAGYGSPESADTPGAIGVTQPRRVAAVSMARRVAEELGDHGGRVAHQIRFDSTVGADTRVKFMTDGVLLREMMQDFRLRKYSAIVIDEAHERNINTDILVGMLSRCVRLRAAEHARDPAAHKRLKLIVMSATLRVADFSENGRLFRRPPPVLQIGARQFPVAVHFSRRTAVDYAEEAFRKTCKIHRRLPPGAILVFLTGQQEINRMVRRLRKEFPFPAGRGGRGSDSGSAAEGAQVRVDPRTAALEVEDIEFSVQEERGGSAGAYHELDGDSGADEEDEEDAVEEGFEETLEAGQTANDPLHVLPLYSLLPTKEQMKVFEKPPAGSRLCIVATNVAETSLTIPGVRYVVDCGRAKERRYNERTGVQSYEVDWISKASAAQRSGRAGRTGPGHCYRLYSSAVFEQAFAQFARPEILRMPVESVVLQMKSMGIERVANFPFPTPPAAAALARAQELLQHLGSLDAQGRITEEGRRMSVFPLSPRFSKILLLSEEGGCLPYAVTIVSALSVGDPFLGEHELGLAEQSAGEASAEANTKAKATLARFRKSRAMFARLDACSDVFVVLSAVSAADHVPRSGRDAFFKKHFLRGKTMEEIRKLRSQLLYIIQTNASGEGVAAALADGQLQTRPPSEVQRKLLKQMVCAGFVDQVAVRADHLYPEEAKVMHRMAITSVPYVPVLAEKTGGAVEEQFVYIHPQSVLATLGELPPRFVVFQALQQSGGGRRRMQALCDVKSTPLANVARHGSLLTYSKPLTGQGMKPVEVSRTERLCYVVPRFGAAVDSDLRVGWDLNPVAVRQEKQADGRWAVTRFASNKQYRASSR